jgi:hypothetical protein
MPAPTNLRALLAQGRHALSLGRVPEVVALIEAKPQLAVRVVELLWDDDPGLAQRAADVLERISHRPSPALQRILHHAKNQLLGLLTEARLKKLRWNLALTIGRLPLTVPDCRRATPALYTYLDDPSSSVKTTALQGLADLTHHDPAMLPSVLDLLRIHGRSGTPAMRARSRILLKRLETSKQPSKQRPIARPTARSQHPTG